MSQHISAGGPAVLDDRKQAEADFHNTRELDRRELSNDEFERKYANKKWYAIVKRSREFTDRWLHRNCKHRVALDYCCGLGGMSLKLAEHGAFVHGIDISDESVSTARQLLTEAGLSHRCRFQVMDGENLTFEDQTFDTIICSGVLHHLDLNRAYPELARVLKPTGRILCLEALGHNPLINLYRRLTPSLRTAWEVDHILKQQDIERAKQYFGRVTANYYHLAGIAAVPLRKTWLFEPTLALLDAVDSVLLRMPIIQRMAWQVVFELSQPRHGAQIGKRVA